MTDTKIIIEVAKLDGWKPTEQAWQTVKAMNEVFGDNYMTEPPKPKYLTSRDAIIPVIERQNFTEEQWEVFLRFCVLGEPDWIACNKIWTDKSGKMQQSRLPRAFRLLILLNAKQLCIALLKVTGRWKD